VFKVYHIEFEHPVLIFCPYKQRFGCSTTFFFVGIFLEKSWFCLERELSSFSDTTHIF
jgi:hypothetical protein